MKLLLFSLLCGVPVWTGGNPYPTIGTIPLPTGYHRVTTEPGSFGAWLRTISLKKSTTVYLYNGLPKTNQEAQFAVLAVSVGHEDLQQCADAVMRLRAEYLFSQGEYEAIDFYTEQGIRLNFQKWAWARHVDLKQAGNIADARRRAEFDKYLRELFMYCSTRTLARLLVPAVYREVGPGDVLIRGGAPGHAMLVVDVAEDEKGHRAYMLAQSYMPAQDIHIVKNPANSELNPWYSTENSEGFVLTPEYSFKINELRTWSK